MIYVYAVLALCMVTFQASAQVPAVGPIIAAAGVPSASLELGLLMAAEAGTTVSTIEAGAAVLMMPAAAQAAVVVAGLVGIQMAYLKLSDGGNNPNSQLMIRPGATSPVPGPTVETSTPASQGYLVNNAPYGDINTACEAAAGYKAEVNFGAGAHFAKRELLAGVHGYGTCMLIMADGRTYSSNEGSWSYGAAVTCAPGTTYSSGSSTCLLPANAYPDLNAGIPVIQPDVNGAGFRLSPGSNVNSSAGTPYANSDLPSALHQAGTGIDGNPYSVDVAPNPSGGIDITQQTQKNLPTGPSGASQPSVTTTNISTNSTGIVTTTSTSTVNNTTINNNTTKAQAIDTSTLNQEATQQKILDEVKGKNSPDVSQMDNPLQTAMQKTTDDITHVSTDVGNNPMAAALPANYWSFSSGTCYPAVLGTWRGIEVTMATFCNLYDSVFRPLIVWILGVLGMLHAYAVWSTTVREM